MVDITYKIGGRKVTLDGFSEGIEKAALELVTDKITKALSSVRCKEHAQRPKVIVKGDTINNLSFEVQGCCQKLIDQAFNKLGNL